MKQYYTYIYRMPNGEPFYIGKGCDGRSNVHLSRKDDSHMARRVRKLIRLGTPPSIEIIKALNEDHAYFMEQCLIDVIGRNDLGKGPLLNHTDGGEGIKNISEEVRAKMSESHKGIKKGPLSKEAKDKISLSQRTSAKVLEMRKHHSIIMTGKTASAETKLKMSNSHKGKKFSPEHLANIRKSAQERGARQRAERNSSETV
jgi:hypothetical protein